MIDFNLSLQTKDVNVLTEAVRTWYQHNHVTPTEGATQLLCSAAVDLFSQGHRTPEELATLLIARFDSPHSLKINAATSTAHH
ncbi:hypothetical protein RLEG3_13945 [Rhizobium leguminosarum bv. trifolii WSM1689]|uniref:hypothetical protein n=1 Tax=Rhizobium TaxID=379 RepID=UPI0003E08FFE|nr:MULTISPECIES: hypothetical protein [Rhizobium]AHF82852.1 hypothetical protein RLEG3_13945 [Rhizobium leguminosarum bv. trifolii WSM1689]MBY3172027.1 hypothetical protein [Rhizobium laguerreae]MBY3345513.1 hypothetical protein [Rhizobium laguerreae]MBY3352158.1 hypothetical protein [Rhizobium laguerreae]MBY3373220.1 hypothetical protein [Rhizobium laguerreae]